MNGATARNAKDSRWHDRAAPSPGRSLARIVLLPISYVATYALLPFTAAKIVGPQAMLLLQITLLIRARVQIKAAPELGLFLLAIFYPGEASYAVFHEDL